MKEPFIRDAADYKRDLNVTDNYFKTMAVYKGILANQSFADAEQELRSRIKPEDRGLKVLSREASPDREIKNASFLNYLERTERTGRIIGPNFINYSNPEKQMGFLPAFIDQGLTRRKTVKKQGQKAEMEGDMETALYCSQLQAMIKILNNSVSGAHASPHNPIYNNSAHTTLTSVCRCATSYSNALVERLLGGNRHYLSHKAALEDLAACIRLVDKASVDLCIATYNLTPPTADYAYNYIMKSCKRYWLSEKGEKLIREFIFKMDYWHLCAICWVSDFKSMRETNDGFMRRFIGGLINKPETGISSEEAEAFAKNANPDLVAMIGLVMSEELDGRTVNDMRKASEASYQLYGAAIKQVESSIADFQLYIDTFLKTDWMPGQIHSIATSLRDVAIVSDTDSTIFTTEDWVIWFIGNNDFGRIGMSLAGALAYLDSQVLKHILALLSTHLGVRKDMLFRLAMKSEFYQPVMGVTNMSKHYFSYIRACEGNVYKKPKFDTKGVNLKNSRLPTEVTESLNNYIKWVMDTTMTDRKISLPEALEEPVRMAKKIKESLENGSTDYLMAMQVKGKKAYKRPLKSNYASYELWNAVFADKYGQADPPPYSAVKVPVKLDKPAAFKLWLKTLEPDMATRFEKYLEDTISCDCGEIVVLGDYCSECETKASTRKYFTNFLVPTSRLVNGKIPNNIHSVLDIEKVESEITNGYYIVLEVLGIYARNNANSKLLSDITL